MSDVPASSEARDRDTPHSPLAAPDNMDAFLPTAAVRNPRPPATRVAEDSDSDIGVIETIIPSSTRATASSARKSAQAQSTDN